MLSSRLGWRVKSTLSKRYVREGTPEWKVRVGFGWTVTNAALSRELDRTSAQFSKILETVSTYLPYRRKIMGKIIPIHGLHRHRGIDLKRNWGITERSFPEKFRKKAVHISKDHPNDTRCFSRSKEACHLLLHDTGGGYPPDPIRISGSQKRSYLGPRSSWSVWRRVSLREIEEHHRAESQAFFRSIWFRKYRKGQPKPFHASVGSFYEHLLQGSKRRILGRSWLERIWCSWSLSPGRKIPEGSSAFRLCSGGIEHWAHYWRIACRRACFIRPRELKDLNARMAQRDQCILWWVNDVE